VHRSSDAWREIRPKRERGSGDKRRGERDKAEERMGVEISMRM
jgi:hypothetical protein